MRICMSEVFEVKIIKGTETKQTKHKVPTITFTDRNEVNHWADYFGTTPQYLMISFSFYILQVLKMRVKFCVQTQKLLGVDMNRLYQQLSKDYQRQKVKKNRNKFWRNTSFLVNYMRVWYDKHKVWFGIPENLYHPNTHTKAYKIFEYLEFGTRYIPPRPLIYPNLHFIIQNINHYWQRYLSLVNADKISIKFPPRQRSTQPTKRDYTINPSKLNAKRTTDDYIDNSVKFRGARKPK